jgi:hypothetical protein
MSAEDIETTKDLIVAIALEDLTARTEALKGMMPDSVRRHAIAWQSVEILRGLIRRHLPERSE